MKKNTVFQSLILVTQFGFSMVVPILLCTILGAYIGDRLSVPIIAVPLFFVGAAAGYRNVYVLAKRIFEDKDNDNVKKDQ